ncbi:hypothetical protein BHM03_00025663 [Ensete ventricosum]|nr:hypothetical protein BHM03_00025663 [Ensete ventricosum]
MDYRLPLPPPMRARWRKRKRNARCVCETRLRRLHTAFSYQLPPLAKSCYNNESNNIKEATSTPFAAAVEASWQGWVRLYRVLRFGGPSKTPRPRPSRIPRTGCARSLEKERDSTDEAILPTLRSFFDHNSVCVLLGSCASMAIRLGVQVGRKDEKA